MLKQITLWIAMLIPSILVEVFCYILTPVIALFTTTEERTDRVKRMGNVQVTMPRTYLQKWCRWFQTHDNAVDEYWYGVFTEDSPVRLWLREQRRAGWRLLPLLERLPGGRRRHLQFPLCRLWTVTKGDKHACTNLSLHPDC